jgi:hypothetical protein
MWMLIKSANRLRIKMEVVPKETIGAVKARLPAIEGLAKEEWQQLRYRDEVLKEDVPVWVQCQPRLDAAR